VTKPTGFATLFSYWGQLALGTLQTLQTLGMLRTILTLRTLGAGLYRHYRHYGVSCKTRLKC